MKGSPVEEKPGAERARFTTAPKPRAVRQEAVAPLPEKAAFRHGREASPEEGREEAARTQATAAKSPRKSRNGGIRSRARRRRFAQTANRLLLLLAGFLALSPFLMALHTKLNQARLDNIIRQVNTAQSPLAAPGRRNRLGSPQGVASGIYEKAFSAMALSGDDGYLLREISAEEVSLSDKAVRARAKDLLARNAAAIRLIHRASAESQARAVLTPEWSPGLGFTSPAFMKLLSASRLLALESSVLLHEGRVDDALAACQTNLRLANSADADFILSQLARYACISQVVQSLAEVLYDAQPSPEKCRALADEIAAANLTACFVHAVSGERLSGFRTFNTIANSGNPLQEAEYLGFDFSQVRLPKAMIRHPIFVKWWLAADELAYFRWMERYVARAPLPYREIVTLHPSSEEFLDSFPWWRPPLLTASIMPVYERAFETRDKAIAELGLAEIALLLKTYKVEYDRYPDSLEDLAKSAGRPLPVDPFSGQAFFYYCNGRGFVLYSWGPNLKDDNGTPSSSSGGDEDDIVFQCLQ